MIEDQTFQSKNINESGLPDSTFAYCEFLQCDFSGVNLHEVSFEECQFVDCNFSGALIAKTAFKTVQFQGCKLTGIEFKDVSPFLLQLSFDSCILELSSFYALELKNTRFQSCQLKEADFVMANLEGAQFLDCDLSGALFEQCNLQKANFRTALNYRLQPEQNQMKKAKFNANNLRGLLDHLNLDIS